MTPHPRRPTAPVHATVGLVAIVRRIAAGSALAAFAVAVCLLVPLVASPSTARGAEPSSAPAPVRPSCNELYPEEGPAGVDLRLGCLVDRLLSHYTGREASAEPAALSAYLPTIAAIVAGVGGLVAVAALGWRRLDRRLAPVMPAAWWACPTCRSVNGAGTVRCYACGAPAPTVAEVMTTADHPEMRQAFGGDPTSDPGSRGTPT